MQDDDRILLYESNLARLERQVEGLQVWKKKLIWFLVVPVVLAVPAFAHSLIWGLSFLVAGPTFFGVGHYLALMHLTEDTDAIAVTRRTLEGLRRSADAARVPSEGTPSSPPADGESARG